jgi:type III restriction enzyme
VITLKDYQERVLDSLRGFFRVTAQTGNPDAAFRDTTRKLYGEARPYLPVSATGLGDRMPYVCLRVPTGGGKTLLACYAAGLAQREFVRAERAVVLWLVPSNTITGQFMCYKKRTNDVLATP